MKYSSSTYLIIFGFIDRKMKMMDKNMILMFKLYFQ